MFSICVCVHVRVRMWVGGDDVVGPWQRVPRWYKCFNSVNHALPDYVGKVFVQRYSRSPSI